MKFTLRKIILFLTFFIVLAEFLPNIPPLIICKDLTKIAAGDTGDSSAPTVADDSATVLPPSSVPFANQDGTYSGFASTVLGDLTYYNQHDIRWGSYLWGGRDPLTTYGCGPTALAMLVTSFSTNTVTPIDMAQWALANGGYAAGSGSAHNLIPDGLNAYGLKVQSQYIITPEALISTLQFGKVLVALMGPGHFTSSGHFIILTGVTSDGLITVVDPQSYENTIKPWSPEIIVNEVKPCGYGGPIWAVSKPPQ